MLLRLSQIVLDPRMRGICRLPYPNHPKGCPNFDHKAGCPPSCPTFDSLYALDEPVFVIVNEFDLGSHVERMRAKYPAWTDRQLECCLYWQPKARKQLKALIAEFQREHPDYVVDTCPEAGGVNVTATLANVGISLEWPPKKIVRQVALAAKKKGGASGAA